MDERHARHQRRIVRYIQQWGPVTVREIGDALMLDMGLVERILDRLALAGRIRRVGADEYDDPRYAG